MSRKDLLSCVILAVGGLCPATVRAADMEVGPGKAFATIQAGIDASTPGADRVLVYGDATTPYNEQVVCNKAVDIVAAPGNDPILKFAVVGKNDVVVVAYMGTATWDGIDIQHDQPNDAGTIFFNLNPSTTITNIRNLSITDTPNAVGNVKTFFTHGGSIVNIDNLRFAMESTRAEGVLFCQVGSQITANDSEFNGLSDKFTWINQAGDVPTKITCNRCTFTKPDQGGSLVMSFHGEIELNDCRLVLDGGTKRGVITLDSGQPQKLTLNRCILDGRKEAGGRLVNIEGGLTDMGITNSAMILRRNTFGVYGSLGGTVAMTHSTVAAEAADPGNRGIVMNGTESAGKTLTLSLENNIFSLPGSESGAVAHDATQGGTLALTAGTNLRHLGDGTGAAVDALTGTIIDEDPALDADLIHLTASSPAINAGADLGVSDDIDGDPRPGTTVPASPAPDLGADEFSGELNLGGGQVPGDCNQDSNLDLSDAICLLGHLFLGSPSQLPCEGGTREDEGNRSLLNSNGDAGVDLSDAVHVLLYLFSGGLPPALGTVCTELVGCPEACAP